MQRAGNPAAHGMKIQIVAGEHFKINAAAGGAQGDIFGYVRVIQTNISADGREFRIGADGYRTGLNSTACSGGRQIPADAGRVETDSAAH